MSKSRKIVFSLTGSIAAFKACDVLSELVKQGHEVQVVATKGALEFIGEMTLEGLTGKRVLTDIYAKGDAMEHIDLHKWADLFITCPLTANRINQFANGLGQDLLGSLFLSYDFKKPWYLVPAMNPKMYAHPITKSSVKKLEELGLKFIGPGTGAVACGDFGEGRMVEKEEILAAIGELK